ncbi:hypothetical protein BT69DRAFT_1235003 [Atractiella rhizophila]|nr:hypothetical protein BT69DRAFT_1235003 [Atractiella rhizophila]
MASLSGDKYAFLRMQAPPSYVAGLGRGASGFTTRSDIGPAREGPSLEAVAAAAQAKKEEGGEEGEDGQYQDPENESGLFAGAVYDQEDEEADKIYETVDAIMDTRRKARREAREKAELEKYREERPRIQLQFADLKRGLTDVTEEEWTNLPEVGNLTGKRKRKERNEGRAFVVPDSVIVTGRNANAMETSLDEAQMKEGGAGTGGELTDLTEIGMARNSVLSLKLDQIKDSVNGSTSIDPKGYLTSLDSVVLKTSAEIGDIKKARALLDSVIKTNPKHAPGWIAAARVEEVAGRTVAARKIIAKGCEECPSSDDVWIEAARLNTNENAKIILAQAVQHLPTSVRIWTKAAELEGDVKAKKNVYRKALEYVPASVKLWKAAVQLESSPSDARLLLQRAVEVIPHSAELWLALARLETPERAKGVLNKARSTIPTSHEIWIAAARLQEQEGGQVERIIASAVKSLKNAGVEFGREVWIWEAEKCEKQGSILTCAAIISNTIWLDIEEEDRLDTWMEDATLSLNRGAVHTSRAILAHALKTFPNKPQLWRKAADLEKAHGTREDLLSLLGRATAACPHAEVLWLMGAKEAWLGGDVERAREILKGAFAANDASESIWLAAAKLETENGNLEAARVLLDRARVGAPTENVWMKSVVFQRKHSSPSSALELVNQALEKFPTGSKLYMIKGQLLNLQGNLQQAREIYATGVKRCPHSIPLWILASRLEEQAGLTIKARALLEKARARNEKDEQLWLESIRVEERAGTGQAKAMLARGLQECPSSGLLHTHAIWLEDRPQRKKRGVDALKRTNNSPVVVCTVARLFQAERKYDSARNWFSRAVGAGGDKDWGDGWAWWWRFELEHGDEEQKEKVKVGVKEAEPRHGEAWQKIAKDDKNDGKPTVAIMELVAAELGKES